MLSRDTTRYIHDLLLDQINIWLQEMAAKPSLPNGEKDFGNPDLIIQEWERLLPNQGIIFVLKGGKKEPIDIAELPESKEEESNASIASMQKDLRDWTSVTHEFSPDNYAAVKMAYKIVKFWREVIFQNLDADSKLLFGNYFWLFFFQGGIRELLQSGIEQLRRELANKYNIKIELSSSPPKTTFSIRGKKYMSEKRCLITKWNGGHHPRQIIQRTSSVLEP